MDSQKIKKANKAALNGIKGILPIIFGVLLLVSIITVLIPTSFYENLFTGNIFLDSLIGDLIGSLMLGNPITSYVLGSEFLDNGVSLIAVTAFMVAWVTVGVIQSPVESEALGKRFTIFRNISAFFMAIVTAIITVFLVGIL
ncbi:MAG: hypothetical protein PF484_08785 [Bacteroidales bacterium]|jgi:uncharacterized membrane protein YraQ (UPF0718 family)|nr:hypothetical protein [Bacteroidales bacterium]